jgi:DNA-binding XRE family transcriptional regulator
MKEVDMPKKPIPRLLCVIATGDFDLDLVFDNGIKARVNLGQFLATFKIFQALRQSPEAFARVALGDLGTDIVWDNGLDMSAETLWHLAQEQTGFSMSPAAFRQWREAHDLTMEQAATQLGLSRRMIAYYEKGSKPIPRLVALATRGLDAA